MKLIVPTCHLRGQNSIPADNKNYILIPHRHSPHSRGTPNGISHPDSAEFGKGLVNRHLTRGVLSEQEIVLAMCINHAFHNHGVSSDAQIIAVVVKPSPRTGTYVVQLVASTRPRHSRYHDTIVDSETGPFPAYYVMMITFAGGNHETRTICRVASCASMMRCICCLRYASSTFSYYAPHESFLLTQNHHLSTG